MAVTNFESSLPGVQDKEIDNSVVPDILDTDGPVVIGRALRGPAMQPVQVSSFSEFLEIFDGPTPNANFNDVWRDNQIIGPTYGVIAASAALKGKKKLTFVRLLGTEHNERTTAGRAGWQVGATSQQATGGAYGLFIFTSGSNTNTTGTLAAIWYLNTGSITLSGTFYGSNSGSPLIGTGSSVFVESNTSLQFRAVIKDETDTIKENVLFDFTPTSEKFIRKVFNTNATRLNSTLYGSSDLKTYFLGESFEDFISDSDATSLRGSTKYIGTILALKHNTLSKEHSDRRMRFQNSQTGWFFSQDLNPNNILYSPLAMTKLFKFHALDSGEWNQNNIKISITNIKDSDSLENPYGRFDVLVRRLSDKDSAMDIIERFNLCDLNPNSPNFISRKIGDKYVIFDDLKRLNRERGQYDNNSKFIRVEVSDLVANGAANPLFLPFGVYGPVRYKSFVIPSGTVGFNDYLNYGTVVAPFVRGGSGTAHPRSVSFAVSFGGTVSGASISGFTGSVIFPSFRIRKDTLSGTIAVPTNAFFGLYTEDSGNRFNSAVKDLTRVLSTDVSSFTASDSDATEYAWVFSLDDVQYYSSSAGYSTASSPDAQWLSGSRVAGTSITSTGSHSYTRILDLGFNSFTSPMFGGFDGWDIREIEPMRNSGLTGVTDKTDYAYNTAKRALDILREKTDVDFNIMAFPGLTEPSLTSKMLDICSDRKDAVAIIDLESDYRPRSESSDSEESRQGRASTAVTTLKSRAINTSYGACYYPWLIARENLSNQILAIPPSVAALGVWSINDKKNNEWTAPAGINRAQLSSGHGGIEVIGVKEKLYADDQKKLYEQNINPIAKSTKDGIVIWGQKTLQVNPKGSALTRLSVRRAMIAVRKAITKVASTFVFEANIPATWAKFNQIVTPILSDIKSRFGINDFKLVLDERTTTPDLIDRNIMYAKIWIKPTIAIENIFLDFTLTNQGVDFATLE